MIYSFKTLFYNVKTGDKKSLVFTSTKNYLEVWEDAISYFNKELLKLDKTWIYDKVERC